MSDYLNNLVARTLNLAPVVQPRLGSLFEPTAAYDSNLGSADSNSGIERPTLSTTESHRITEARIESIDHDIKAERGEPREHPRSHVRPQPFGRPTASQDPAHIADQRVVPERNASTSTSRGPNDTSLIIRPSTSFLGSAANREEPITSAPARSSQAQPQPAEGPQTITVTIGRVDVRAVFSPQAPTKVNRTQSHGPMALSDYLKKRNEGRR